MSEACSYCKKPVPVVEYSIHRDDFGEGPEVPLCVECAEDGTITCEMIWDRIARPGAPDLRLILGDA